MNENPQRFFVLTGGPGSGKSTLIEGLRAAGYAGSVEAGRAIIQDQLTIGGRALPWKDPLLFAELMLSWDMHSYRTAQNCTGPVFFDRGVPDVVGYLRLLHIPIPKHMGKAAEMFRYNHRVFIAPPWQAIFHPDRERKQDFDEAKCTYEALVSTYASYGYELIEIPRMPSGERVRFILDKTGVAACS